MSTYLPPDFSAGPAVAADRSATRVVLVTGAAKRIGKAIAEHFAQQGWAVAVHFGRSRQEAEETVTAIGSSGGRAAGFGADLADEAAVRALVPRVKHHFGRIDALINNASLFEFDDAGSLSFEQLQAHIAPNLGAPIILSRALFDAVGEKGEGAVVNMLDQKLYNLNPDFFSYTMSKAGLAAANIMLAQALAPRIRVVGVAPGLTLPSYLQDEQTFLKAHKVSILGRSSTTEDIVRTVYFAATNPSMTGNTLLCDGGQHLLALPRDISKMELGS